LGVRERGGGRWILAEILSGFGCTPSRDTCSMAQIRNGWHFKGAFWTNGQRIDYPDITEKPPQDGLI